MQDVFWNLQCSYNYAFPTGSVYGFGIKRRRRPADASVLRNRKQYKNSAYIPQSRPISHIVWTD